MEQPKLEQEIDLMPYHQVVDPTASSDPEVEQVPRNQGDIEILRDNPEEEMHNISFDESQHRVFQLHKVSTPYGHTSPSQIEE